MSSEIIKVLFGGMLTVILTMSTWTLVTVHGLAKTAAAAEEKEKAQDSALKEDRARIMAAESNITDLQLDIVALSGRRKS